MRTALNPAAIAAICAAGQQTRPKHIVIACSLAPDRATTAIAAAEYIRKLTAEGEDVTGITGETTIDPVGIKAIGMMQRDDGGSELATFGGPTLVPAWPYAGGEMAARPWTGYGGSDDTIATPAASTIAAMTSSSAHPAYAA